MKDLFTIVFIVCSANIFAQSNQTKPLHAEKGNLLFSDDFERTDIGDSWTISEKFDGAFAFKSSTWGSLHKPKVQSA